ncbi:MAG: Endonuclease I [uncultured Aureispira sp.]|uniref:Endonuclease I n=1 Tax=uncultured Aureispira sp. TaxID=1331704 RepID=A0A6S6SKD8_9BACT|nr:MAG: Endonuclease I [uncultured Aureispira sp.]
MFTPNTKLYFMRQKSCFFLIFIASIVQAQHNQQTLFVNETGQTLLADLVSLYKPSTVLSYNRARDTMFSKVYNLGDSVRCVYTGHQLYLNPQVDPSTFLYSGGSANGINTEHTYPQSKGASRGNAKSDLHHLFPTRTRANSDRSNFPYGEIADDETTTWYYKTFAGSIPTQPLDVYSELHRDDIEGREVFEPKEAHKGNAARAVFYFYTMYKAEADAEDPTFFAQQLPSICQWHVDDPVDSLEWERTHIIATYQDGKANPFVLDCSLPFRTYCPHLSASSCFTSYNTLADFGAELYQNFPNPVQSSTTLQYELDRPTNVQISIYSATGQCLKVLSEGTQEAGLFQEKISCSDWANGAYAYRLRLEQDKHVINVVKQFIVAH